MHPNPKEKAKELIDKMYAEMKWFSRGCAKKCAIIAVNEIINFLNRSPSFNKGKETDEIWGYWQQVKEELTKQK